MCILLKIEIVHRLFNRIIIKVPEKKVEDEFEELDEELFLKNIAIAKKAETLKMLLNRMNKRKGLHRFRQAVFSCTMDEIRANLQANQSLKQIRSRESQMKKMLGNCLDNNWANISENETQDEWVDKDRTTHKDKLQVGVNKIIKLLGKDLSFWSLKEIVLQSNLTKGCVLQVLSLLGREEIVRKQKSENGKLFFKLILN